MTLPLLLDHKREEKGKSYGASRKINRIFPLPSYIISTDHSKKFTK